MRTKEPGRLILLTALAWAFGLFFVPYGLRLIIFDINLASKNMLDPSFGGYIYALFIGPACGGAFAGYWTVRLLKRYANLPLMRALPVMVVFALVLLMVLLLPVRFGNLIFPPQNPILPVDEMETVRRMPPFLLLFGREFLSWLLPGIFAGFLLVMEIQRGGLRMSSGRVALISAGWGFGFAVGGGSSNTVIGLSGWLWWRLHDPGWLVQELVFWLSLGIAGFIIGVIGAWSTMKVIRSATRTASETIPM